MEFSYTLGVRHVCLKILISPTWNRAYIRQQGAAGS